MATFDDQGWLDVTNDAPRAAYTATAGQTQFTIPFVFTEDAEVLVYIDDVLQTTGYTLTGEETELDDTFDGGQVEFTTAMTGGEIVVLTRQLDIAVSTHIPPSGPLDIPSLNLQISKLVMMLQQIDDDRTRSIRQPDADATEISALPVAASRASKYLYFDANGDVTVVAAVSTSAAASSFWASTLQLTTAAASRAALGITDQAAYTGLSNWHSCR